MIDMKACCLNGLGKSGDLRNSESYVIKWSPASSHHFSLSSPDTADSRPDDVEHLLAPRFPRRHRYSQPGGGGEHGDQGRLSTDKLWVSVQQPDLQGR